MSIRPVMRWIGRILVTLSLLLIAVFGAYRLRGPTQQQRAALALLQADYRPQQGTNAFALLGFMRYASNSTRSRPVWPPRSNGSAAAWPLANRRSTLRP